MKIDIYSDVHIDSWKHIYSKKRTVDFFQKTEGVDLCIFAGDAGNGPMYYMEIMVVLRALYHTVIAIPGNHDHYSSAYQGAGMAPNLVDHDPSNRYYLLDNGLGITMATYWSNFRKSRKAAHTAENNISDFVAIPDMTPELMTKLHNNAKDHLRKHNDSTDIIVTHFPPIIQSESPKFAGDSLNPYFVNDDDEFFKEMSPRFWIHGHTHESFDYIHYETRVVCNPMGYFGEKTKEPIFLPRMIET